eukprot:1158213-Pelagomonas_calceolata.AAC.4
MRAYGCQGAQGFLTVKVTIFASISARGKTHGGGHHDGAQVDKWAAIGNCSIQAWVCLQQSAISSFDTWTQNATAGCWIPIPWVKMQI